VEVITAADGGAMTVGGGVVAVAMTGVTTCILIAPAERQVVERRMAAGMQVVVAEGGKPHN
jgi:hypothetical protein